MMWAAPACATAASSVFSSVSATLAQRSIGISCPITAAIRSSCRASSPNRTSRPSITCRSSGGTAIAVSRQATSRGRWAGVPFLLPACGSVPRERTGFPPSADADTEPAGGVVRRESVMHRDQVSEISLGRAHADQVAPRTPLGRARARVCGGDARGSVHRAIRCQEQDGQSPDNGRRSAADRAGGIRPVHILQQKNERTLSGEGGEEGKDLLKKRPLTAHSTDGPRRENASGSGGIRLPGDSARRFEPRPVGGISDRSWHRPIRTSTPCSRRPGHASPPMRSCQCPPYRQ